MIFNVYLVFIFVNNGIYIVGHGIHGYIQISYSKKLVMLHTELGNIVQTTLT